MLDPAKLIKMTLHWEADPRRVFWLKATTDDGDVFIRMNSFPDDPAHSLEVDDGVFVHFNDFPPTWTRGPLEWPDNAIPRWGPDSSSPAEGGSDDIGRSHGGY